MLEDFRTNVLKITNNLHLNTPGSFTMTTYEIITRIHFVFAFSLKFISLGKVFTTMAFICIGKQQTEGIWLL